MKQNNITKFINNLPYVFFALIPLFLGIIIGIFIRDFPILTYNKNLNLGDVANIALSAFIAIYVPFYLDRKINNKRTEKDILISQCGELKEKLQGLLDYLEELFTQKKIHPDEATKLILKIRRMRTMFTVLSETIDMQNYGDNVKKIILDLKQNQSDYFMNLTLYIRDKKPKITEDAYLKAEASINVDLGSISKLMMLINNS